MSFEDYVDPSQLDLGALDLSGYGDMGIANQIDLGTTGKAQATDLATINRRWTLFKNFLAARKDPAFNEYVAQMSPGADTFDFGAFTPGGGVAGQNAGFGLDSLGGGTGGSGGGGGGAKSQFDPYYDTSYLDTASKSKDPVLQKMASAFRNEGATLAEVKANLLSNKDKDGNSLSPELQKVYSDAADQMWKQQTGASRNSRIGEAEGMMGGAAAGTPNAGGLVTKWAGTGMPDPSQMYGPDNLPPDMQGLVGQAMQSSPYLQQQQRGLGEDQTRYSSLKALYDKLNTPAMKGNNWIEEAKHVPKPVQPTSTPAQMMLSNAAGAGHYGGGMSMGSQMGGFIGPPPQAGQSMNAPVKQSSAEFTKRTKDYQNAQNMAAQQAMRNAIFERAKGAATNMQDRAASVVRSQGNMRRFAGEQIAPGRTPGKDRISAQVNAMRALGLL